MGTTSLSGVAQGKRAGHFSTRACHWTHFHALYLSPISTSGKCIIPLLCKRGKLRNHKTTGKRGVGQRGFPRRLPTCHTQQQVSSVECLFGSDLHVGAHKSSAWGAWGSDTHGCFSSPRVRKLNCNQSSLLCLMQKGTNLLNRSRLLLSSARRQHCCLGKRFYGRSSQVQRASVKYGASAVPYDANSESRDGHAHDIVLQYKVLEQRTHMPTDAIKI